MQNRAEFVQPYFYDIQTFKYLNFSFARLHCFFTYFFISHFFKYINKKKEYIICHVGWLCSGIFCLPTGLLFYVEYNCSILFANRVKGCKGKTEQGEYIVYGIRAYGTHKIKTAPRLKA